MIWSCRPCTLSSQVIEVNTFLHCKSVTSLATSARLATSSRASHGSARHTSARHGRRRDPLGSGHILTSAGMAASGQAYACLLGQKHPSMAIPELRALCEARDGSAQPWRGQGQLAAVWMPSDAAMMAVVERATLTKCALALWASGSTVDDAARAWASVSAATVAAQAGATFRFEVYSPHRKLSNDDKRELMQRFPLVPLTAKLDSPQLVCWLLLLDGQVSIGRQVAVQAKGGSLWPAYRLSSRPYVGPTSLDPELTFVMANLAGAGPCSLVLDPFCGTGSTLLACAHFGATHGVYTPTPT